jgi:hypothetical protein
LASGCTLSPGVPALGRAHFVHAAEGLSLDSLADVWISYQITVAEIDGVETRYRPDEPCLYYRLSLPAGEHVFGLLLDYDSMTHSIRSEGVVHETLRVEAGRDYRLIDLSAGTSGERALQPWLLEGAPEDEEIAVRRP